MSVKKLTSTPPKEESFWIVAEGGGYVLYSSIHGAITPPDVWAITSGILLRKIRQALGM